MYFGTESYGLEDYIKYHGDGSNLYRGETFAQPRTLKDGDILSNGWMVVGDLGSGFNGSPIVNFSNGLSRVIAPRLALQLLSDKRGVLPAHLRPGTILQTGCVVLDNPRLIGAVNYRGDQEEVEITITGGREGHSIGVPYDIELAVFDEEYPPSPLTTLGAFALENTLSMNDIARRNLPQLGKLALDS